MKKETRGGKRPGSGRKKMEPTAVISWRVPAIIADELKTKITPIIEKAIKKVKKDDA